MMQLLPIVPGTDMLHLLQPMIRPLRPCGPAAGTMARLLRWLSTGMVVASLALPAPARTAMPLPAADTLAVLELPPSDPDWRLRGDVDVGRHDGRDALLMRTGSALHRGLTFTEGTVEFDLVGTVDRAFLGLVFRRGEDGTAEDVYLRLHKSRLPDAVQYTPDYRGRGQWQLYHGPSATARATFTPDTWQHVRIEVRGGRAAVFVGEAEEPQLVVDRLRTGREAGGLGLWANQPGAGPDAPLTAAVAGLRVLHDSTTFAFGEPAPEGAPPGTVAAWGLSDPFPVEGPALTELPVAAAAGPWRVVEAEPSGLLPLDRHLERVDGGDGTGVLAGLRLRSDRERTVALDLGFSDNATVFLNGRPVVTGRFAFSHNFPRRQGLLTPDQATVHLPLRAGANDLVVAVSETAFGGWGLLGRIAERDGLEVVPLTGGS